MHVKTILLSLILLLLLHTGLAQDILFKKNGALINCKIREITVDVIKYKRTDLQNSPVFEIKKEDVYKIRYKNGVVDVVDPKYHKNKNDTTGNNNDTTGYSMLYVVYNPGHSSQVFPLYINERFICKLKHHSRLAFKMKHEGEIVVYRKNQNMIGPQEWIIARHGNSYAISIQVVNEQNLDPNQRFLFTVIKDAELIQGFLENEYNGFKPEKDCDFHFVEN
jgi:hypothetical protein